MTVNNQQREEAPPPYSKDPVKVREQRENDTARRKAAEIGKQPEGAWKKLLDRHPRDMQTLIWDYLLKVKRVRARCSRR